MDGARPKVRLPEPVDERVEWVPWERVRQEVAAGRVVDGFSLVGLLWELGGLGATPAA